MLTAKPNAPGYVIKGFAADDLRKCAERELGKRRGAYPRWIEKGKMTTEQAERELAKMQAIAEHFAELAAKDRML